jgi:glycine cleavage system H lipoate-binding protein
MAKQYKGDIWIEEGKGTVNIGFTNEFIREILSECFHITQASAVMLTKDRPMLTVETNEGLKVIRSPVTGTVLAFDHTARDFPDKLTEDSVVLRVKPASVVVAATKKVKQDFYPLNRYTEVPVQVDLDWLDDPQ